MLVCKDLVVKMHVCEDSEGQVMGLSILEMSDIIEALLRNANMRR